MEALDKFPTKTPLKYLKILYSCFLKEQEGKEETSHWIQQ